MLTHIFMVNDEKIRETVWPRRKSRDSYPQRRSEATYVDQKIIPSALTLMNMIYIFEFVMYQLVGFFLSICLAAEQCAH